MFDISGYVERMIESFNAITRTVRASYVCLWLGERVEASATYSGGRIGAAAGERFFTKEPVGLGSLAGLVG